MCFAAVRRLTIVCLMVTLLMGCSFLDKAEKYTPMTRLSYETMAASMMESGDCIPVVLKNKIYPRLLRIQYMLDQEMATPEILIKIVDDLSLECDISPLLNLLMRAGVIILSQELNDMGFLDVPLRGQRLAKIKALFTEHTEGIRAAIRMTEENKRWCE